MKHPLHYPPARQDDVVEDYHGTSVADPYRWLEDAASDETTAFAEAQQALTRTYLDAIPTRATYKAQLTKLWDYDKYTVPSRHGTRVFFFKHSGLQSQPILYKQESLSSEAVSVLDPNQLSDDGTLALTTLAFSQDGTLLAYGISASGSDWQEIRIHTIDAGAAYTEVLKWCKFFRIAWRHDNSGFFYNRSPEPGTVAPDAEHAHNKLYWHQLGTPQAADRLIYERPDSLELKFPPLITNDERYLVLYVWHQALARNRLYYRELSRDGDFDFVRLIDEPDASYIYVGNDGATMYIHTDLDAPRGRVIAVDLDHPERANWCDVIPEGEDTIAFVAMVGNTFVIAYLHHAYHQLQVYDVDGTYLHDIALPTMGAIVGFSAQRRHQDLFIAFQSFVSPTTLYRYEVTTGELHVWRQSDIDFDPADYETKQVFVTSKDGTRVPMFLTHQKGIALDGKNPTLLYGYGGYSISLTPAFSLTRLPWLARGGVYAQVNLRGGNEYGDAWHRAGILDKKQNVFDDCIAAAEWLIAQRYTAPKKLGIMGRSNGGLLVGACMTQRPDLFGAVICGVGVLDMLRFHRYSAGRYWTAEYGNAEADPDHFVFLYAYSPYHQVREGVVYPPILIHTGDTDDRVVPMHSLKFAARLQAASHEHSNPILLRYDTKAGHGLGKPTAKVIDEFSDIYAFLLYTLVT